MPTSDDSSEAALAHRFRELVRTRPFVAVAAAGALGVALGAVVFSRLGKLVFLALAGYAANELWRREGRIDLDRLIAKLANQPREEHRT